MTSWRRSAALRLSLAYTICLGLGIIALGAVTFWTMHHAFQQQIDADINDEVARLTREYDGHDLGELREAIGARVALNQSDPLLYGLYDARGRRIAGTFPGAAPPPGVHSVNFIDADEGPDEALASSVTLPGGYVLSVAADSDRVERLDRTMVTAFSVALVGVLVLGAAGAFLFARLLRERLGRLAARAEAISGGAVSTRMPVSERGDEFDALATSLNQMLGRIQALVENLRQVSGAVAHDLRTPLTRLRQKLETASQGMTQSETDEVIADALSELDEVLALFREICMSANSRAGPRCRWRRSTYPGSPWKSPRATNRRCVMRGAS